MDNKYTDQALDKLTKYLQILIDYGRNEQCVKNVILLSKAISEIESSKNKEQ